MKEVILAALAKLDPTVDSHWTAEGLVNLNSFKFIAGGVAVTREQLEEVAPNFTRSTAHVDVTPEQLNVEAAQSGAAGAEGPSEGLEGVPLTFQASPLTLAFSEENFSPVVEMGEDQLTTLCENYLANIDELNAAREQFNKQVDKAVAYLHSAKAEQDRRQPKMTLAEMVRKAHELNANSATPASAPRARPHPVYPVLTRK